MLGKTLSAFAVSGLLAFALAGCENEGPMEEAGENIDEGVEETREEAEQAGDAMQEQMEETGDAIEEKTDQ